MSFSVMTNETTCPKTQSTAESRAHFASEVRARTASHNSRPEKLRQALEIIRIIQPHPTQLEFVW